MANPWTRGERIGGRVTGGASAGVARSAVAASRRLAALGWMAAAACATPSPSDEAAPITGCYALYASDMYGAVTSATGLPALPPYVALDATPVGVRGRRLIVPVTWQGVGPSPDWASWRVEGHGLVLTFVGTAGSLVVSLRATQEGYRGHSVNPFPRGVPPVLVTLVNTGCVGLVPGAS